jgi:hypothetical protein
MKNNGRIHINFFAGTIIIFILILLASSGCDDKSRRGLIPDNKLEAILSDSYLSDGLFSMPSIRNQFSKRDTTSTYVDIINSYGYSYEEMEKTLNYYFINDPKRLVRIYDRIAAKLNEEELMITAAQQKEADILAEKTKKRFHFYLPDPELKEKPYFSYELYPPGVFTLKFSVTLYPDDQAYHPRFIAWYSVADGADSVRRTYFPEIRYLSDGWPHTYIVKGRIEGDKKSILQGLYYEYDNNPGIFSRHAEIVNLNFSFLGDSR